MKITKARQLLLEMEHGDIIKNKSFQEIVKRFDSFVCTTTIGEKTNTIPININQAEQIVKHHGTRTWTKQPEKFIGILDLI